jgi:hypothetical protein
MTFPLNLNFLENTKPFLKPPKVQICLVLAIGWLFVSGFVVIIPGLQIDRTEKNGCARAHRSPSAHPLVSSGDSLEHRAPHVPPSQDQAPPRTARCRPSDPIGLLLTP